MLTIEEIKTFIDEDATSVKKQLAKTGQRYYEGDHDIRDYKLYYFNADGQLVEDTNRSNIKISHPFFTELTDQEVQYMLSGKDGFVRSDLPELQVKLDEYFNENEDFTSELYEVLTGAIAKGFEYMWAYKKADGKTGFKCADSIGVVEVEAKYTRDKKPYIIYWYIERIDKEGKLVKKIIVFDEEFAYYFQQLGDSGDIEEAENDEGRHRVAHVEYTKDKSGEIYYESLGYLPFFRLDNCKKQFSGLKTIKNLIDDYDLMSCGLSNNIQDASEYLVVVKGFQGDNIEELMQNVKTKKHIGVDGDSGGDVEFKTVDIPTAARQAKLELDEKNIYRFGMGFNSAQLGDGNVTNIVIKSRYALLDLKCNKLEIRLKQFLRKILNVILNEINDAEGTDYQQKDVYFVFEREVMTNASDNAQIELTDAQKQQVLINTLLSLSGTLDDETIIQNICDALDINYEEIKNKLPKDDIENAQSALDNMVIDNEQAAEGSSTVTT